MKLCEEQLSNKTRTSPPAMRTKPEAFESEEGTSSITEVIKGLLIIASVVEETCVANRTTAANKNDKNLTYQPLVFNTKNQRKLMSAMYPQTAEF